jgi:hypothetical protein
MRLADSCLPQDRIRTTSKLHHAKGIELAILKSQFRPVAASDDCPSDKACDILLRGNLSVSVVAILRCIARDSEFIENQDLAPIHKIVLGLSLQDLQTEIIRDPRNIDIRDAMGRTALEWAAARGEDRAVVTLLSFGADPNIVDNKLNTPLTLASNQTSVQSRGSSKSYSPFRGQIRQPTELRCTKRKRPRPYQDAARFRR